MNNEDLERYREALEKIAVEYCTWYDKGVPQIDASGMLYYLVSIARIALNPKETPDDTNP